MNKKETTPPNLSKTIDQITKDFGKGSIMRLGDKDIENNTDAIPTGILSLDMALGVGGIPKGRITEIYGPESAGKSTLAQNIIAEAQKEGGLAAYIDVEHALDPEYAAACGINTSELLISQPDIGQSILIIFTWLALIFVSGINLVIFFGLFGIFISILSYLIFFVEKFNYIKIRISSFFDTSSSNKSQAEKASEAIIDGGFFGKGIGEGTLNYFNNAIFHIFCI